MIHKSNVNITGVWAKSLSALIDYAYEVNSLVLQPHRLSIQSFN